MPVSRWDGKTTKQHPVTGEDVPDETAQVPLERYVNPRRAEWPPADVVVGNPPFIGNKRMRDALGDGYVEALRAAWAEMPESADFVMYWWHKAAGLVRAGSLSRFGFITTNSVTQTFNRRVLQRICGGGRGCPALLSGRERRMRRSRQPRPPPSGVRGARSSLGGQRGWGGGADCHDRGGDGGRARGGC